MLTREHVEAHLAQVRATKTQVLANYHAAEGAEQCCLQLLALLSEASPAGASQGEPDDRGDV